MQASHNDLIGKPAQSVRDVRDKDGAALLDIEQGACYSINPIGSRIWDLLKLDYSVEQIVDHLAADFEVPRKQLSADVTEFIGILRRHGLLADPGASPQRKTLYQRIASLVREACHFD